MAGRSRRIWPLIVIALGGMATLYTLGLALAGRQPAVPFSSRSSGRDGLKAVRLLMEERGVRVSELGVPLDRAPAQDGLIFLVQPASDLTASERKAALRLVESGATLVLCGDVTDRFLPQCRSTLRGDRAGDAYLEPQGPAPFFAGVNSVFVTSGARLSPSSKGFSYLGDESGCVLIIYPRKRGRFVLIASPGLFTNEVVDTEPSNALLALGLARAYGSGKVQFAEYYHGFGTGATGSKTSGLLPGYIRLAFWQIVAALIAGFLTAGFRFGRPLPLPAGEKRNLGEYLNSMAGLYRRANAGDVAVENLYRNLLRVMTEYSGQTGRRPEELARVCAARRGFDPGALSSLFKRCESIVTCRTRVSDTELLQLSKQIDLYRREFERHGAGN